MNRRKIVPVVLAAVLAMAGAWYWYSQRAETEQATALAAGTADSDQVQLAALISGRVVEVTVVEGDAVNTGDVLYRIDSAALKLQVDQAEAAKRAAKAAWDQAVDDDESDADIAAAKAQWQQTDAAVKLARIQLGYATVTAPATGTVTAVAVDVGELASPGRTLATIMIKDSTFVRAFVAETAVGRLRLGGSATIVTNAGDSVDGTVSFIASEAQFTPSNVETKDQRAKLVYEVRIEPSSPDALNPGMPVTVDFAQ